jgi:hypothetical protein
MRAGLLDTEVAEVVRTHIRWPSPIRSRQEDNRYSLTTRHGDIETALSFRQQNFCFWKIGKPVQGLPKGSSLKGLLPGKCNVFKSWRLDFLS